MTNDTPEQVQHNKHLDTFRGTPNGSRNDMLNKQAVLSFGLALGNQGLPIAQVENDFTAAAATLGLSDNEIKGTLRSALDGAIPYTLNGSAHKNQHNLHQKIGKKDLMLAPTYTALEDYAKAHGVPVSCFETAKWELGEHDGRKCFLVPLEDGTKRARFLDGNSPKWKPIAKGAKPCWYGFNSAITMASKSEHKTVIICNGQPSVIAAQHHSLSALAQTDGEDKDITEPLLKRLKTALAENGLSVVLAYDGDGTGRAATKRIQEQLMANDIKVSTVYFGGDKGYDLADYCKQHRGKAMERLLQLSRFGQRALKPVVSRSELVNRAFNILSATRKYLPAGELLIVPFKSFHKLGGFAFMLEPGRSTMILGPSGCGKSAFIETWNDFWNKLGIDTFSFSPEWSPLSMQYKCIQRNSGIPVEVIQRHVLWNIEAERGIAEGNRQGTEIKGNSKLYKLYNDTNDKIAKWPGELYVFQGQKVTGEILEDMSEAIWIARRNGRRVGVAFFDYVQILRTARTEENYSSYETICSEITQWSRDMDIHTIICSQPTKAVGENAIRTGALLSEYDAMWMRPDVAQLIITLNIKHDKVGDEFVKSTSNEAIANVCKNNDGQVGKIDLITNFKYLEWKEAIA